jgi:hypothetical protein
MKRIQTLLLAGVVFLMTFLVGGPTAHAQSLIKNPGDHPPYKVELEPHLALGWGHLYRGNGLGVGARVGIVIVDNGFIKTINNSVAISFGADWIRYSDCYYYDGRGRLEYGCGASYFVFPVTMQWNFWLTPRWSVFGEPGLYFYHGLYDDYCRDRNGNLVANCGYPTRDGVDLALYVGGRFHFNDKVALTMRLGYPTSSVGVSFFF